MKISMLSILSLGAFAILVVMPLLPMQAYAHGCQAQGGCCTFGGACAEGSLTPLGMMIVAVGIFGVLLDSYYGRSQERKRLYSALNIFE
jgi:hypothetical protein